MDEAFEDPQYGKNSGTVKLLRQKTQDAKTPSRVQMHMPPKQKEIDKRAVILEAEGFNM